MKFIITKEHFDKSKQMFDDLNNAFTEYEKLEAEWNKKKQGDKPVWDAIADLKASRYKNPVAICVAEVLGLDQICVVGCKDSSGHHGLIIYYPNIGQYAGGFVFLHRMLLNDIDDANRKGLSNPIEFHIDTDKFPLREVKNRESPGLSTYYIKKD